MAQQELFDDKKYEHVKSEVMKKFPIVEFELIELTFGGQIIAGFVRFKDSHSLSKNWKDLNGYLSVNFISNISDDFSKWNFYLFYVESERVAKAVKYEIENNKFSSRKIVIDGCDESLTKGRLTKFIASYITNSSIELQLAKIEGNELIKDPELSSVIDQLSYSKKKGEKEIALNETLDKIETILPYED
jgi:hypothetical protein